MNKQEPFRIFRQMDAFGKARMRSAEVKGALLQHAKEFDGKPPARDRIEEKSKNVACCL